MNTTNWYAAAAAWRRLAERIDEQLAEVDEASARLGEAWHGEAAEAAKAAVADLRARTAALRLPVAHTERLLTRHAYHVGIAKSAPVLAAIDARTAAALHALADEPPGAGPAAVRLWWDGLSPTHRAWLLRTAPDRIGGLDGIPAVDRDRANREILRRERTRLAALLDKVEGKEHDRIRRTLDGLAVVQSRLDGGALLLGLDPKGDGKAIVAFGDPDHARDVMTFVPGMHTALDKSIAGNLDHTVAMAQAAGTSTSAVLWLGYDAPDGLFEAARAKYADDARAGLHSFQEGLVATHDGEIGEQSVVGYSYGALVVGETARDLGLSADDLVFLGAPGVGVGSAADLHVDPDTVWAASADNDIVGLAAPSLKQLLVEQLWPRYMGDPMPDLWHGHNPADPGFGGHVFEAANRWNPIDAHLSYWDEGNPTLTSVGLIASGREAEVTRP